MRLVLAAVALAAISLLALSRSLSLFHGPVVSVEFEITDNVPEPDVNNTKYFFEPGNTDLLGHYDVRFYQGHLVSDKERKDSLHHMIRAYLSTFRDLHVETWIAHGTLLGWWWNGQILPWDWDLDVQVSGDTLAYMAEYLNYTTHSYKSGSIERQYFLDVNPNHRERVRGDGWNIIDARWIDVRNGLFVDITGIAETFPNQRPGVFQCKNEHYYNMTDIWPLRESTFEGVSALVPFAYDKVLTDEYETKALTRMEYEGHRWNANLEKWIQDDTIPTSGH